MDTNPDIEQRYQLMLMKKTGAERAKMASSMFSTARAFAMASLKEQYPSASEAELRGLLFLRIYGADFSPGDRGKILQHLLTSTYN